MALVKVQDYDHLLKDTETGAILNTNRKEIDDYKARKASFAAARAAKEEINNMMSKLQEVDELKKDIAEIKEMLKGLVK